MRFSDTTKWWDIDVPDLEGWSVALDGTNKGYCLNRNTMEYCGFLELIAITRGISIEEAQQEIRNYISRN